MDIIDEKTILQNQIKIVACAKAFRKDANKIMNDLANDFKFRLDRTEIIPKEVYKHKYNCKGNFRNDWTYFFHGAECRFDNLLTGQIIELIYITTPEFGFLDGLFFYNYMASTDEFKTLAAWFNNSTNVWEAIRFLADNGILRRDYSVSIKRNIIAP